MTATATRNSPVDAPVEPPRVVRQRRTRPGLLGLAATATAVFGMGKPGVHGRVADPDGCVGIGHHRATSPCRGIPLPPGSDSANVLELPRVAAPRT